MSYKDEKKRTIKEIQLSQDLVFENKAKKLENTFQQIYQSARTISLLPTMRNLTGRNLPKGFIEKSKYDVSRLPSDSQMTVQQLYNNLLNNISASEIYAILKGFKPDQGETPFFMFDKYKIDPTAKVEEEEKKPTPDTPEQVEDEEYSYYTKEMQSIEEKYSHFNILKDGIDAIPMTNSSLMRTCDNAQYESKSKGDLRNANGLLFNVPFFKTGTSEFLGIISVIIRSNVFEALLVGVKYIPITDEEIAQAKKEALVMPDPARFVLTNNESNLVIADRRLDKSDVEAIMKSGDETYISRKLESPSQTKWELHYGIPTDIINAGLKSVLIGFLTKLFFTLLLTGAAIWYFITSEKRALEKAKTLNEASRLADIMEKSPLNLMTADLDGKLTYLNLEAKHTLTQIEKYLSTDITSFIGQSLSIFKINLDEITDHKKFPYKTIVTIGSEKIEFTFNEVLDSKGIYLGPLVTWNIVTDKLELITELNKASDDLSNAAANVLAVSSTLSAAAEETSAQANTASVASEEVNSGIQSVANNVGEMSSAIKEITVISNEAAQKTAEAMSMAKNTNEIINKLGVSSTDIGNVIKVISSIAQQTNLLALNATIEAARAGEAGKGFAVVANEVKELAKQTAKATQEITKKIENIQSDSNNAVAAIAEISTAIEQVNGFNGNIAHAMKEQADTIGEVSRIVSESAEGMRQISENVSQVSDAANSTGKDANSALIAAKSVGATADLLKIHVGKLKI